MKLDRDIVISPILFLSGLSRQQAPAGFFKGLSQQLAVYRQRVRTRYQLSTLSEAQLRDVGISPAQAEVEISKFFWEK